MWKPKELRALLVSVQRPPAIAPLSVAIRLCKLSIAHCTGWGVCLSGGVHLSRALEWGRRPFLKDSYVRKYWYC